MQIKNNKYMRLLQKAYVIGDAKSEYYKRWMTHKYRHSIEVAECGIDIINGEKELYSLPEPVKEDFVSALLLHDLGRTRDIHRDTGENMGIEHAIEGAMDIAAIGETSLNIIIPVLIHSFASDAFVEGKKIGRLNERYQNFMSEYEQNFLALSEEEKRVIRLGVDLVKDADKLANFLDFKRMTDLSTKPNTPIVNERPIKEFFEKKLTNREDRFTVADHLWSYLAWFHDLRFKTTMDILMKNDVFGKIRTAVIDIHKDQNQAEVAKLLELFDKGFDFVRQK